jgi:hypothetical protein
MDITSLLPAPLLEAVKTEAEAHNFDEAATRWLALLLRDDAALPAPTAAAMVKRVRRLPVGAVLASLDEGLQSLPICDIDDLTTSERRVIAALLSDLVSRANVLGEAVAG